MSGVGLSELIILFLIGLIVLGPERLPRVANQIGNWIGQARRMTRVMKRQLEDELDLENTPDIKPSQATASPSTQDKSPADPESVHLPANEADDEYSPAHDADDIGTGVADDEGVEVENIQPDDKDPSSTRTDDDVTDMPAKSP